MNYIWLVLWAVSVPLGAWYTLRAPAVRNDTWGGAFCFFLGPIGFIPAWLVVKYFTRRAVAGVTRAV